jgi:hypothetical protein
MRNDIQLHIFTNATVSAPSTQLIQRTYNSFCETFGSDLEVSVWCDPSPNVSQGLTYLNNLRAIFEQVNETQSLSDGFVKAVKSSTAPYLFMLEHDWQFLPNINHSLSDIMAVMREQELIHFRFNKRSNVAKRRDLALQAVDYPIMPYCTTRYLSNNPHIIDLAKYKEQVLPLINVREKSFGIEDDVSVAQLVGAIYGPANYPATVAHLNGKTFLPEYNEGDKE